MGNEDSGCYSCQACNNRNYSSCDNCSASCCVENMNSHREIFKLSEEFLRELEYAEDDLYTEANNIKNDLSSYYGIYLSNDSYSYYNWRGILNSLEDEIDRFYDLINDEESRNYSNMNTMRIKFEQLKQQHQNNIKALKQKFLEQENLIKNSVMDNDNKINQKKSEKEHLTKVMKNIGSKKESILKNYEKEELSKADLEYKNDIKELDKKYIFNEEKLDYTDNEIKIKNQYLDEIQKIKKYSKNPLYNNFITSFGINTYLN